MKGIIFTAFGCTECGTIVDEIDPLDDGTRRFSCPGCGTQGTIRSSTVTNSEVMK